MPVGEFADRVIEDLIGKWNSASNAETLAFEDLSHYRETGELAQVLEKLRIFRPLVEAPRVPALVRAIGRLVPDLSRTTTELWDSERDRALRLVLILIEDRSDPQEIQPLVQEVVQKVDSWPFVVTVVSQCAAMRSVSYYRINAAVNVTLLRNLASERLTRYFIEGNRDIFEELPGRDLPFVVYQWATNWETDTEKNLAPVRDYIMNLIYQTPEYLGKLLSHFRMRTISGQYTEFQFQSFIKAFDPSVISECLARYGDAALATPEAKESAELFQQQYAAYKSGMDVSEKKN